MALNRFFNYFGSKAQVGRHYPKPRHGTIIEPFAGGAGYSLWHHHLRVVLIEKSPITAGIWRYLIAALADWCRSRRGQVIVCENEGARWLPFRYFRSLKSMSNDVSREAIWTNDEAIA